jgi:hypothetical protein
MIPPIWRSLALVASAALLAVLVAAPAEAARSTRMQALGHDPAGAARALDRARALADGHGVRAGRELTLALAALESRRAALDARDRRAADGLLARPTDTGDGGQPGGPYTVAAEAACSTHFCFHWVRSTDDAPDLTDAAGDGFPDYVNFMAGTFEEVYQRENGAAAQGGLEWRPPKPDGGLGGDARTDVYIKDIGRLGLYGYASRDPDQVASGQPDPGTRYAFLVMDNDYSATEFPQYEGDASAPARVTAAHEYNHVLQYGYDAFQDKWMHESTATWVEEQVYDEVNDYRQYVGAWAQRSLEPLTLPDNAKIYGTAVWQHWLSDRLGQDAVRRAWEVSLSEGEFGPAAQQRAISDAGGGDWRSQFVDFAVATAEWDAADAGVHEGNAFPAMARISGNGGTLTLPTDGTAVSGALDHTGYALFDVAPSTAPALQLTGSLPAGTAGGLALVGRQGDTMTKVLGALPNGGQGTVTLPDPGRFTRITAVIVNADTSITGYDEHSNDWQFTKDEQAIRLAVTAIARGETGPSAAMNRPPTPTTPTASAQSPPSTTPRPAARALMSATLGARQTLHRLARGAALVIAARADRAGSVHAVATLDAAVAKRLGLSRRVLGTGRATLRTAGTVSIRITPARRLATHIKRLRRALRIRIRVSFTPTAGAAVTQTLTSRLKP